MQQYCNLRGRVLHATLQKERNASPQDVTHSANIIEFTQPTKSRRKEAHARACRTQALVLPTNASKINICTALHYYFAKCPQPSVHTRGETVMDVQILKETLDWFCWGWVSIFLWGLVGWGCPKAVISRRWCNAKDNMRRRQQAEHTSARHKD